MIGPSLFIGVVIATAIAFGRLIDRAMARAEARREPPRMVTLSPRSRSLRGRP